MTEPTRQFASARLLRRREPYHFQRGRERLGQYPRPAQPNQNQQTVRPPTTSSDGQYWIDVYNNYSKSRQGGSSNTNLALGRK